MPVYLLIFFYFLTVLHISTKQPNFRPQILLNRHLRTKKNQLPAHSRVGRGNLVLRHSCSSLYELYNTKLLYFTLFTNYSTQNFPFKWYMYIHIKFDWNYEKAIIKQQLRQPKCLHQKWANGKQPLSLLTVLLITTGVITIETPG